MAATDSSMRIGGVTVSKGQAVQGPRTGNAVLMKCKSQMKSSATIFSFRSDNTIEACPSVRLPFFSFYSLACFYERSEPFLLLLSADVTTLDEHWGARQPRQLT